MKYIPENIVDMIRASGVATLPDNPSAQGFSAAQIKAAIQRASTVLANYLLKLEEGVVLGSENVKSFFGSLGTASNYDNGQVAVLYGSNTVSVYVIKDGAWTQIGDDLALTASQIDSLQSAVSTLEGYFTSGKANKALADEDGNNIKSTYETKSDATTKDNANVHLTGNETISGKKTFTVPPLFQCDIQFDYQYNILMWDGFLRTTTNAFLQIGGDSANKVTYQVPYYGHSYYGNTYILSTTDQVATAKAEALSSAASTAQDKVDALASALGFSNGAFGTIVAALLKVTKMEVTNAETKTATLEDQFLEMLAGNTVAYGTNYVGFVFTKYDGSNDFFVGIYNDTLMLGDCIATRVGGKITSIAPIITTVDGVSHSSLEPLATRAATSALTNGHLLKWDGVNLRLIDAGVSDTDISTVLLQESSRVSAENARVLAEQSRVEAETKRALQEKYRVINHPYAITQAEYNTLMNGGVFGVHLSTPLVEGDDPELICTVYASEALAEAAEETYIFPIQDNIQYPAKDAAGDIPPAPSVDGTYVRKCTVTNGVAVYYWEEVE